ncbi:S1 RNA-binding domain-containing protein [Actinoplanes friuliensis]|uniref:30S ribosomal protein S1 n=1 Tax=Actinoplanes friuliensis DSM 7358 TaxID=1246995 RepID=U5WAF9_9ACTN|nr:S1 RNA-binding domain-containing protein [Actinoplanes friuliensis]AGZ44931.1 30S ribosomal protein S1 [Actinoplanes friuliensis DSM 7358]
MRYADLESGQVLRGVVSSVHNFGLLVDVGGITGLVNAAHLTWSHDITHPDQVARTGDALTVMVVDVDLDRERATFSLKALEPDPLAAFARTALGTTMTGEVIRVAPFGVFVRVAEGIAGLVRDHPAETGDLLRVEITAINLAHRRVTLRPLP